MMHRKRSSSRNSSADIIGGNVDLLMQILRFLPPKSLVRSKLVSKRWRALISSRFFSRLHILHNPLRRPQPPFSYILGDVGSKYYIFHPTLKKLIRFRNVPPYMKILQSCNGLLLVECKNSRYGFTSYHIFNPITKRSTKFLQSKASFGLHLIFDPSESPHYKVICFRTSKGNHYSRILVYDSKTNKFKRGPKSYYEAECYRYGINWNNSIYFNRVSLPSLRFSWTGVIRSIRIRSITLPFPVTRYKGRVMRYVVESNGHLHYLVLFVKQNVHFLSVYEMSEDGSQWIMWCSVDMNPISAEFAGNNGTNIRLLAMIRGEMEEDAVLFHVPGKIMVYRVYEQVFEVLVDFRNEDYFEEGQTQFGIRTIFPFIESFAPV